MFSPLCFLNIVFQTQRSTSIVDYVASIFVFKCCAMFDFFLLKILNTLSHINSINFTWYIPN